jgi:hypothetical protein
MAMLSDMDNFMLSEIGDLTLNQLDTMTYEELVAHVRGQVQKLQAKITQDVPLPTDSKENSIIIENFYLTVNKIAPFEIEHPHKWTAKALKCLCEILIGEAIKYALEHPTEIFDALKQANHILSQILTST